MSKKAIMDVLLLKVAVDRKDAFIAALREAGSKKERIAVITEYCGELTAAEKEAIEKASGGEISDELLDSAAGGGCCQCGGCYCGCH